MTFLLTGAFGYLNAQQVKVYTPDSSAYAVGDVIDGKKTGKWIFYDQSGNKVEEGTFEDNRRNGVWKIFNPKGTIRARVKYSSGEPREYQ